MTFELLSYFTFHTGISTSPTRLPINDLCCAAKSHALHPQDAAQDEVPRRQRAWSWGQKPELALVLFKCESVYL